MARFTLQRLDALALKASTFLVLKRLLVLRLAVLACIWGGAFYLCAEVAGWAMQRNAAPLHEAVHQAAPLVVRDLQARGSAKLEQLARATATVLRTPANAAAPARPLNSVLYSFSYQNDIPHLLYWDQKAGTAQALATSFTASPELLRWLENRPTAQPAMVNEEHEGLFYLTVATTVPDTSNAVVARLGWWAVLNQLILPDAPKGWDGLTVGLLAPSLERGTIWVQAPGFRPASDIPPSSTHQITSPLPGLAGWQLAYRVPEAALLGSFMLAQALILAAAAAATLMLFWGPSHPIRQKITTPVVRVLRPLAVRLSDLHKGLRAPAPAALLNEPGTLGDLKAQPTKFSGFFSSSRPSPSGGASTSEDSPQRRKAMRLGGGGSSSSATSAVQGMDAPSIDAVAAALPPTADSPPATLPIPTADDIRACLSDNRVRLLFQPIFDATNRKTIAHEVLVRLVSPDGETPYPTDVALNVAKDAGLIGAIDSRVLELATEVAMGLRGTPLFISVNISGASTKNLAYLQHLMEPVNRPAMEHIMLELASREILGDSTSIRFLKDCQALGARLAIDYFGGGVAMLEGASRLKLDFVKIDARRFEASEDARTTLVNLGFAAKRMGLPIILEKMENVEMEVLARKAGIGFMQGYLFAKPTPLPTTDAMPSWRESLADADKSKT